ncbi:MAG: hypothetical protein M5U28_21915 [Sandaracinaceae bacterium]|nr:hypothetical protein [Sandaracinaceae bacterium]
MRAADAGWLLSAIARGGVVELPAGKDELLEALGSAGLVRTAPDPGPERAQLAQLRGELARIAAARAGGGADPALAGRERGLRSAIVEMSERLAESEGATEIRRVSGAPYRGGAALGGQRWQLTQRGRRLLSDLGPRSMRLGEAPSTPSRRRCRRCARRSRGARAAPPRSPGASGAATRSAGRRARCRSG